MNLRSPDDVMRLAVLGASCQTRLSFMRTLLRKLKKEQWQFRRARWEINKQGAGVAVYEARGPERMYSLAVFSHVLPPDKRSDRVIADAWDATFTLVDGALSSSDLTRMQKQVPLQEAGRNTSRQLVLSRANRSARTFNAVVDALANGRQAGEEIARTGYLMRTTAVYGNGKFGVADRTCLAGRHEFSTPFSAELLAVYMFRAFPPDLAEHLAAARSSRAVVIGADLRRTLGIGNSTGLGMAPFLVNHPALLHHWIVARETALLRRRKSSSSKNGGKAKEHFLFLLQQAAKQNWRSDDAGQQRKITHRTRDLKNLVAHCKSMNFSAGLPWNRLYEWGARHLSLDGRELLVSLILESGGGQIDNLSERMSCDESFTLNGAVTVGSMRRLMKKHYAWTMKDNFSKLEHQARFWYVSEEKLEPRLGERQAEPGAELELPLAIMRDARQFALALEEESPSMPLFRFLLHRPEHRGVARRAQMAAKFPYSEVRDNLISATMLPLDLLRCKLSFFGAAKFDPLSDRWLRINMFQHAPYPGEFGDMPSDEWAWHADAA